MEKTLRSTIVFEKNQKAHLDPQWRIICNEGGTGSSKTVSLAQLFAVIMMEEKNARITIARKTLPSLRATSMKDFFDVLKGLGAYKEEWHNKSEHIYKYMPSGSEVDFLSVDEPIKVRSRRRNYLWMNEANEFMLEDYRQLTMRTDKDIFMDYNPSHQYHWIYDEVQTRKDCLIIPSTFRDNPFLPKELVNEIKAYKDKDKNYWRIYGLGLRGIAETLIYTHWKYCDELPSNFEKKVFGLDFGFNAQTAFVEIREKDKEFYWKGRLYERFLTNPDLIERLKLMVKEGILTYNDEIFADHAEPARIKEIKIAGFNIMPCIKEKSKDGIDLGIDFIKSHGWYIVKDSVDVLKEAKSYNWKEKNGRTLDTPVKTNDHYMDAGKYAVYTSSKKAIIGFEWL